MCDLSSKTYTSTQNLKKGDIVQLVKGQAGYVSKLFKVAHFKYNIPTANKFLQMGIYKDISINIEQINNGNVLINAIENNILLWSHIIQSTVIYDAKLYTGKLGIYILIRAAGVIILPNGKRVETIFPIVDCAEPCRSCDTIPILNVLIKMSYSGQIRSYSSISGTNDINVTINNSSNLGIIYGTSNSPLYFNNRLIINNNVEYSYAVFLSSKLHPVKILQLKSLIINSFGAFSENVAYVQYIGSDANLVFNTPNSNWQATFPNLIVNNLGVYNNYTALIGVNNLDELLLYQFNNTGCLINNTKIQKIGSLISTIFINDNNRFLIYFLTQSAGGSHLSEYNVNDNMLTWTINAVQDLTLLGGSYTSVGLGNLSSISIYNKLFPKLFGVVENVTSDNVTVNFIITSALAPLIPGEEYFIDEYGDITTIEKQTTRYLGTAINEECLLMRP